jgi:N-acetylneuraminic acid mutarotase
VCWLDFSPARANAENGLGCPFDCDGDGQLAALEIERALTSLFDAQELSSCTAGARLGQPRAGEILRAVQIAALAKPLCAVGGVSRWLRLPPLAAEPRQEVGVAVLGREVYVVGGISPTGVGVTTVEAYDPLRERWRRVADLPRPLHHVAVAADGQALYAAGGFAAPGFRPVADVYRYDPAAGVWESLPPLPEAVGAPAAVVASGKLHVLGGSAVTGSTASHFVYDLAGKTWSRAAALPVAANHLAAVARGEMIYAVGGRRDGSGFVNHPGFYRYDPGADHWEAEEPLPTARSGHAAAIVGDWLVVFGGEVAANRPPNFVYPHVEAYHFPSRQWFSDFPMPVPRHGLGAAVIDGRVYLPGGATRAGMGETAWSDAWEWEGAAAEWWARLR